MLINPSRECCAYADIKSQGRLEIRRVGDKLEPVLCSAAGERPIPSHNLPKLKSANHVEEAISKLARGYVRVAHSSGEWHVTYQSKRQSRGFSPLVISSQEAAREGRDLSGSNNPVESRLDVENRSCSSSTSDGSSAVFVEEGGAPGENIPAFENGNFEPNSPRSTISADRVSLLSVKELPYLASAAALVVDGGAAAQESGSSISSQTAEMIMAIFKAAIEPYVNRMDSTLKDVRTDIKDMDQKLSSLRGEMSAQMSEEFINAEDRARRERAEAFINFEDRARRERAEERIADKKERAEERIADKEERAKERIADKEERAEERIADKEERVKERAADKEERVKERAADKEEARKERAQERAADKKERAEERASDKEEAKEERAKELDQLREVFLNRSKDTEEKHMQILMALITALMQHSERLTAFDNKVSSLEEKTGEIKENLEALSTVLREMSERSATTMPVFSTAERAQLMRDLQAFREALQNLSSTQAAHAQHYREMGERVTRVQEAIRTNSWSRVMESLSLVFIGINLLPAGATAIFKSPGFLNFIGSAFKFFKMR